MHRTSRVILGKVNGRNVYSSVQKNQMTLRFVTSGTERVNFVLCPAAGSGLCPENGFIYLFIYLFSDLCCH